MIKSTIAVLALTGIGLVGYFYVADKGSDGREQRVKRAVSKATNTVVDATDSVVEGTISGAVKTRLLTTFGLETARYLHVTNRDGRIVVYGLLGPSVSADRIKAEALKVPGVREVQLIMSLRPDYLTAETPAAAPAP